jgi:nicotinate phosphoribosyltransferase
MGIDPATKTVVFSDGLTMKKAIDLWKRFSDRINVSFGIGTHLTNDFDYSKVWPTHALQIVLKMVRCNGQPVAKLSNSPGKTMCKDEGYLEYLRSVFRRE